MPGFVETTVHTGYGYVDPYVQKTRNTVPLFDKTAQSIEYYVPPVIKKVDQLAEPTIQKIKPRVEPIVHMGIEKADELKKAAMPYYEGGVKRVDKAKAVLSSGYEGGVKCAEDVQEDIRTLVRVKGERNLQELKTVSTLNKLFTAVVTKLESLMDRYLPAPPSDADTQSDSSLSSDKSSLIPRVQALPFTLIHRIVYMIKQFIPAKEDLSLAKLKAKAASIQAKGKTYVVGKLQYLRQTTRFQNHVAAAGKAGGWANASCEKVLGKERMQSCVTKIGALTPVSWKAALSTFAKAIKIETPKAA